jgi:ComF family protein
VADPGTPVDGAVLCGRCLAQPPPFAWHRSGLYHEALAAALIAAFKYRRRRDLGARLAAWAWSDWEAPAADTLVPVPLPAGRLRQRGFNQALVLARWAGRRWRLPVTTDGIERLPGPPQVGLTRAARQTNMRGRLRVTQPERFAGKTIVLVDDVYTTGATLTALSRRLLAAGADEVRAITLARRM